jgi:peroxiredoxin
MKEIKMIGHGFLLAAVSLAALFVGGNDLRAGDPNLMETAKLAPSWELQDLDGKTVHSADFAGKVIVLDFWATWCPPCRGEIPGFIALQRKYSAQGFAVVGVSVDEAGVKTVKAFAQKEGINYPIVLTDSKVVDAYGGIDGLPTTFIIDRSGHIVKQHLGFTDQAEIENEIKPLLKPQPTAGAH